MDHGNNAFYYPHSARRKTCFPEDSRAYWQPHPEHYQDTKIKPRTSESATLASSGPIFQRIQVSARLDF